MEIGNPNSSTVIVDNGGNVLQHMSITMAQMLTKSVSNTPLTLRRQNTDIYLLPPGIKALSFHSVYCTVFDTFTWDMDTDATIAIAHGLGSIWYQIMGAKVLILDDTPNSLTPLDVAASATGVVQGGITSIDSTNINLWRLTGGSFDNVNYSGAGARGYLLLWFTA